jgi:predicted dehydrogenase
MTVVNNGGQKHVRKFFRFVGIYGLRRSIFKALGRSRLPISIAYRYKGIPDIALVGCGQFGVTTIGYFILRNFGKRIKTVYDISQTNAESAHVILGTRRVAQSFECDILRDDEVKFVYVASNHATHADYAIAALQAGKTVYLEKPIAVTWKQLVQLQAALSNGGTIFSGYNRPFSKAIRSLRNLVDPNEKGGISLNCFVAGHVIHADHWYRLPEEGTRICGNAGHWIDLFVHLIMARSKPNIITISILHANDTEFDDNFSLSISTDKGDIFALVLSSRSEPFEGINETILLQQGDVLAKIDDFRRMTVWKGSRRHKFRYWPKDAGHQSAILQPFANGPGRDWNEIVFSAMLVLKITNMVRHGISRKSFKPDDLTIEISDKFL